MCACVWSVKHVLRESGWNKSELRKQTLQFRFSCTLWHLISLSFPPSLFLSIHLLHTHAHSLFLLEHKHTHWHPCKPHINMLSHVSSEHLLVSWSFFFFKSQHQMIRTWTVLGWVPVHESDRMFSRVVMSVWTRIIVCSLLNWLVKYNWKIHKLIWFDPKP